MADPTRTLYVIYNANGSLTGKLIYGYRKLTAPKPTPSCDGQSASTGAEPVCAACDITHGGLSLRETPEWVRAKTEIESEFGVRLVQLHRDEVPDDVKAFVKREGIRYPVVILGRGAAGSEFSLVLDSSELARCEGDAQALVTKLREKGIAHEQASL